MVELRAADCYMSDEALTRGLASYHAFQKAGGAVDDLEVLDAKTSQEARTSQLPRRMLTSCTETPRRGL